MGSGMIVELLDADAKPLYRCDDGRTVLLTDRAELGSLSASGFTRRNDAQSSGRNGLGSLPIDVIGFSQVFPGDLEYRRKRPDPRKNATTQRVLSSTNPV